MRLNDTHHIQESARLLQRGELVAMPTETVYGLAGNALMDHAVAKIYAAKGRPSFNPLIVHVSDLVQAWRYAIFNPVAERLAQKFWPGPLTLVLPRAENCPLSLLVSAGLDSVAIRVPAHPLAQALLQESNLPLAAPSANRSGRISPTQAAHVREELGDGLYILDGGACEVGVESTVVDCTGEQPVILRPGAITQHMLCEFGVHPQRHAHAPATNQPHVSPGQLESHYAPTKPLRINADNVRSGEALLAFGASPLPGACIVKNLSESGNLTEAAANLFRMLRELDSSEASAIAAMPIPEEGLGVAINDRLRRAAADK